MSKKYTLTAALPYTNGPVHIGHLAGVYVPADIYARFLRAQGKDVAFICGSDEHGVAITMKAKKENTTPQAIVDKYHAMIRDSFAEFGISFNHYSRTTSPVHAQTASDFFRKMYDAGQFIEEVSEQFYDEEAHQFLADRYIVGTCPKCSNENAYGDQCEKCGSTLSPDELINPKSTLSGNTPIKKSTKHWYLPLEQYQDFLQEWIIEGHKDDWKTNVYGQVKSWLQDGLRPRAVTRDLDWGIPVPVEGAEGKVLYVWFDAPIGYISSTKEWAEKEGKNWEDYWKSEDTELIHFIGKDNIVFHCVIFPAMLKAHGGYVLPTNVPANEFLNLENDKISTSRNWAVWLHEYLQEFPDKQDVLRYTLTANMPETKDNNFTWKDFQTKNNSELVGNFGNFINRVTVLTQKYYEGKVPQPNDFSEVDLQTLAEIKLYPQKIEEALNKYRFRDALAEMMNLARLGNKYLADEEPWKQVKENPERVKTVMYVALQVAAALSYVSEPFLPFTAQKLKDMLQVEPLQWQEIATKELLKTGHQLGESRLLFDKIEDEAIDFQIQKLENSKKQNTMTNMDAEPQKEICTFDDFTKIDLRVGTILEAKKVEKADKLLELRVDTGIDVRTIVSGIAGTFSPEEIIGKQVTVLVNLAPRKIRGIESQGMLLLTEKPDGKFTFVTPEDTTHNGVVIG